MYVSDELESELNAESTEQAVDNDVREKLIKAMKTGNMDSYSIAELICFEYRDPDYVIDKTVDMLMQNFIITPRS